MAQMKVLGLCRAPGCGLVAFKGEGACTASVRLSSGTALPHTLHAADDGTFVVRFPLVEKDVVVCLADDHGTHDTWFGHLTSKVRSRVLTKAHPQLAGLMRSFAKNPGAGRPSIEVMSIWPGKGDTCVWRIRAMLVGGEDGAASLRVLSPAGADLCPQPVLMEDQRTKDGRVLTFSATLPAGATHACVWVEVASGTNGVPSCGDFVWVEPEEHERLFSHKRYLTHAPLDDPMYDVWLGEHPRGGEAIDAVPGFTLLLANGAALDEGALWHMAKALEEQPRARLVYCDEDRVIDGRAAKPQFKTMPSITLLRARDYFGSALLVRDDLLEQVRADGPRTSRALRYAASLRAMEEPDGVVRVQKMLCHVEGPEQAPTAQELTEMRAALEEHLSRTCHGASVAAGPVEGTFRVAYPIPEPAPMVSIIIPNKDHVDLLEGCVSSILEKTDYPNYEILVVENNSERAETFEYYRQLRDRERRVRVTIWLPHEGEAGFNFPAICNCGAARAHGQLLCFLNNDTDVIDGGWMRELVAQALRPEVGVVGAKLLFYDGLVQHVGMFANELGNYAHMNQNLAVDNPGYGCSAALPMEYSMVTGACMMMRRSVFDEVGGFDERLAVGFNDGDLCLSAGERGYSVVCTPDALLHHREFSTRGREAGDPAKEARLAAEKDYVMAKHPAYFSHQDPVINTNLMTLSDHWELRW